MEIWKDVVGYEGFYEVSNLGRVRGKDRIVRHSGTLERIQKGKVLKLHTNRRDGYVYVGLHMYGKTKSHKVHRLVAKAFIPNHENKSEVNHLDENKSNNIADNLEWATRKENENWGTKIERQIANTDYSIIARKNSKATVQKDIHGNIVRVWDSLAQIHDVMGYSRGNISMACNGKYKHPLYGCYWEYEKQA